jgi:hypothetical protein
MILLTAILGLWDWGARDLEHDTGGPGFGAAFLDISAGLALGAAAAGVILRLTIFGLQKRKPDWDVGHAWWFILLIPLAFAPQVFTRLLNH